jgi:DNA-binding GntR family transcriptional regulator
VSRAEYVFTQLRDDILSGSLSPGTPLVQSEIAHSAGVSVTPVREALRRLESAGLVSYEPHLGATVTRIGDDALEELYLLRARVEGLAARLAAARWSGDDLDQLAQIHRDMLNLPSSDVAELAVGSRRFHRAIARIGGPAYILGQVESIWERSPVDSSRSIWNDPMLARQEMRTHEQILDAIGRRDVDAAESVMAGHIADAITIRRRLGGTTSNRRSVASGTA